MNHVLLGRWIDTPVQTIFLCVSVKDDSLEKYMSIDITSAFQQMSAIKAPSSDARGNRRQYKRIQLHMKIKKNKNLFGATTASTLRAICQSSNKFGYSLGSASDSAAFGFT
jgi:hypothetical protein